MAKNLLKPSKASKDDALIEIAKTAYSSVLQVELGRL